MKNFHKQLDDYLTLTVRLHFKNDDLQLITTPEAVSPDPPFTRIKKIFLRHSDEKNIISTELINTYIEYDHIENINVVSLASDIISELEARGIKTMPPEKTLKSYLEQKISDKLGCKIKFGQTVYHPETFEPMVAVFIGDQKINISTKDISLYEDDLLRSLERIQYIETIFIKRLESSECH